MSEQADIAYLREKAGHFRKLAEKAPRDQQGLAERLLKLAADLDAKADALAKGVSPPP